MTSTERQRRNFNSEENRFFGPPMYLVNMRE
jgi:hypothetical protein